MKATARAERAVIECGNLDVGYGDLCALRSVNVSVCSGEIVALIGTNGIGKTTLLLTLAGELPALAGSVSWLGETTTAPLHVRVRDGLAFVPEERILVMSLSVRENLKLGGVVPNAAVGLFAELGPLLDRRAGLLSGGEQQMLTLARALGRRPKAIIVDELSLGLAPQVAERLGQALRQAAESGLAVLVVEQNLRRAIEMSDRFYFMRYGHPIESRRSADYVDRADELAALLVPASLTN